MIWRSVSELSAALVPGDVPFETVENTDLFGRCVRAILIVAVTALWVWGLIR